MLSLLDNLIRQLLMDNVKGLREVATPPGSTPPVTEAQIGFGPPNDDWTNVVAGLQLNAINVFLIEVRENRRLRSNQRERGVAAGIAHGEPAPARLDCHYLVSGWSPTQTITPAFEPVLDEHQLLYETAAVLIRAGALNPSEVYPAGSAALGVWPAAFRDADLPVVVGPPEGFPKLAEFWGTMGAKHPWRPALHLVVTLPIELLREPSGPMVTTRITEYRHPGNSASVDVWIQIAGQALDARTVPPDPVPVANAWVHLETGNGQVLQRTHTNELGRFTFVNVRPGSYLLRAGAVAVGDLRNPRAINVPSPSGEYDLRFT